MIEMIGYTGALLLAVCAIPQAITSIITGNSRGLSHAFLWSWLMGEILMLFFTVNTIGPDGPFFYNYLANTGLLGIITYYKYFERGR